jgi:hypothetical protein
VQPPHRKRLSEQGPSVLPTSLQWYIPIFECLVRTNEIYFLKEHPEAVPVQGRQPHAAKVVVVSPEVGFHNVPAVCDVECGANIRLLEVEGTVCGIDGYEPEVCDGVAPYLRPARRASMRQCGKKMLLTGES